MSDKVRKITEDTLIPISMLLIIVGFVSWLTTVHNETQANTLALKEIKDQQRQYNTDISTIREAVLELKYEFKSARSR